MSVVMKSAGALCRCWDGWRGSSFEKSRECARKIVSRRWAISWSGVARGRLQLSAGEDRSEPPQKALTWMSH